jgi:hypothetical protein
LFAGSFFLELSDHSTKDEAEAAMLAYGPDGEHMRVSRRFIRGVGWRYLVRLDGFEDRDSALAAASSFTVEGTPVSVVEGLGYKREVIATVGKAPEDTVDSPDAAVDAGSIPSAKAVLKMAAKAHGGRSGGGSLLKAAPSVQFSFASRTVVGDKEWSILHHFYRSGTLSRLEVDMVKGGGVSNTVVLGTGGKSWVATHELVRERDTTQAEEMMARFAPESGILSIALGFAGDIKEASEWRGLITSGRVNHRGRPHFRLVPKADSDGKLNALEAALFDEATHLLAQVTWVTRGGRVTFQYDEYQPVAERLIVPHRVRVERNGKLVEEVEVKSLQISPTLSPNLFKEPAVIRGKKH